MFGHKWGRLSLKSVAAARTASAGSSLSIVNLMFATAASLPDARGLGHAIEGDLEPLDRRRTSGADRAGALAPKLAGHFLAGAQLLLVLPEGEAEAVAAGAVDEQESADKPSTCLIAPTMSWYEAVPSAALAGSAAMRVALRFMTSSFGSGIRPDARPPACRRQHGQRIAWAPRRTSGVRPIDSRGGV